MPFTTIDFILFFAIIFFGYYVLPHRFRWMYLLLGSWVFYGWMSPYYLIFLAFATSVTYLSATGIDGNYRTEKAWLATNGKKISREEKKVYKAVMDRHRRRMSCCAIVLLLLMLVVFKYLEFLFVNIAWLGGMLSWHWRPPVLNLILPIGLSFYVFQSLAYVIDVQRGEVVAERNFFKHALYVSYFPQIMQGPIGNYGRLASQFFVHHDFKYEQVVFGLQRIVWGFFKKLMIANTIATRIDPVWSNAENFSGVIFWIVVLFLYAVQLYADFSGYMDIACGCSQMLGIELDENFNCPYFSKTVSDFWRRWHMSLSSWFRAYLFYPILRSKLTSWLRKCFVSKYLSSVVPTIIALAIVWIATGLWHGASWGYVVWGVYYGVFMIQGIVLAPLYERFHNRYTWCHSKKYAFFQIMRTFVIVLIGYSIFKPADLNVTWIIWKQIFSLGADGGVSRLLHVLHFNFIPVVLWMMIMFFVDVIHYNRGLGQIRTSIRRLPLVLRWGGYLIGVSLILFMGMYGAGFAHFEYFKF